MRWHQHAWQQGRHHLFKGSAFVVTAVLFALVFIIKPKWINMGLDVNLDFLKTIGRLINARATSWGDSFEAFTRFFNFERILLFVEAGAVVKLIMLAFGGTFRGCYRGLLRWRKRREARN